MNAQEHRSLQEAYLEVCEGAAGRVADRAAALERQRKGQTPERKEMYRKLKFKAQNREEEPKTAERHRSLGRKGGDTFGAGGQFRNELTQSQRDKRREAAVKKSKRDSQMARYLGTTLRRKQNTEGPGTTTKNPKKLRKQKAMGEIGENFTNMKTFGQFVEDLDARRIEIEKQQRERESEMKRRDFEREQEKRKDDKFKKLKDEIKDELGDRIKDEVKDELRRGI